MTNLRKEETKTEVKELMNKLESVNDRDKEIILASLKGMLLVVDVNRKSKEQIA